MPEIIYLNITHYSSGRTVPQPGGGGGPGGEEGAQEGGQEGEGHKEGCRPEAMIFLENFCT